MIRAISIALIALMAVGVADVVCAQESDARTMREYTLGVDDIIDITVFGNDDLTGVATVDYRGMIQVPLVGEIRATGQTLSELGEYLTERYRLLDPSISEVLVSIVEYKSRSILVVGEVRSPDVYGFVEIPSLWDVILTAGGPGLNADLSHVEIIRANRREGEPATIVVDLSGGIGAVPDSGLPVLYPQDKIFVPTSEGIPTGDQDFQILGMVGSPGTYRISVATNVVEAISASGGPTPDADLSRVYLTRDEAGGTRSWQLNLEDYLFAAQTPQNLDIRAGDTITVSQRESFLQSFGSVARVLVPVLTLVATATIARNY